MISGEKEDSISFPVEERISGSVFDTGGCVFNTGGDDERYIFNGVSFRKFELFDSLLSAVSTI